MFSGRRIKTPEQGLLAMHPFVDLLEGRSLFTASLHEGTLAVNGVIDVAAGEPSSPWSNQLVDADASSTSDGLVTALDADVVAAMVPAHIALKPGTAGSAFADGESIGDTAQTLFFNSIWDRRGAHVPPALPSDEQLDDARLALSTEEHPAPFRAGRPLTGAMAPYLTMALEQGNHPFAG